MSFKSTAAYTAAMADSRPSIALVTGGKSGIGLALAKKIASFAFIEQVVTVSRSITQQDVANVPKLTALAADVTTIEGRNKIVETVQTLCQPKDDDQQQPKQLRFLIHSAGTIEPIKPLFELQPEELRHSMVINCEAPLFLTTALYPFMKPVHADQEGGGGGMPGRVLHVSSGAAHGAPPVGWAAYGISKAAFFQSYKVLERDFREVGGGKVLVGSFKPGVVDTTMQGTIRQTSDASMPLVQNFINMKDKATELAAAAEQQALFARPPPKGALDSPDNVAFFAEFLLVGTTNEEFTNVNASNEYDIRDASLFERWIEKEHLP